MCRQLFDALSDVCGPQNYHSNVNKIGQESQSGSLETSCLLCLTLGGYVFAGVSLLVGWFINRITHKLLNRLPPNLDGGWVSAQSGPQ